MSDLDRCPHCTRIFMTREQKLNMPGTIERENIDCPYCHRTARTEVTNGFFRSYPATPDEEREYEIRQKPAGK